MATNAAVIGNLKALLSLDTSNFDKGVTSSEANAKKLADRLSKDLAPSQQRINALVRDFAGNRDIARALEYATAIKNVGGATKLTAAEQAKANRVVQEAIDKYKALGQQAPAHLIALANATKQVKKPTDDLGMGMTSLLGKAKSLAGVFGVTIGAGALVGSVVRLGAGAFAAADQVGTLATKMGVSVEAAQRFQFAARQSGADIEDISRAIVGLNSAVGAQDKGLVQGLDMLGLKFSDIRKMNSEDMFRAIADAATATGDPIKQATALSLIFGEKVGAQILPMIRENSLKAADGIKVMSKDTVDALKEAKQSWENFWNGLTVISGNTIAGISTLYDALLRKIKTGLPDMVTNPTGAAADAYMLLARIASGDSSAVGEILFNERNAQRRGKDINLPLETRTGFESVAEREAREKKEKERLKRIDDIVKDFTDKGRTERISDLTAALRGFKVEDLTITQLSKLRKELDEFTRSGEMLNSTLRKFRDQNRFMDFAGQPLPLAPWFAEALNRPLSSDDPFQNRLTMRDFAAFGAFNSLMFDAFPRDAQFQRIDFNATQSASQEALSGAWADIMFRAFPKQVGLGGLAKAGFKGSLDLLPQTLLQAFTGGGDIGKSIGALFGGGIGTSLMGKATEGGVFTSGIGKMLQKSFLGNKLGGMVASFIPGLGALIGPLLGKAFSAIAGIGANTTKKGRDAFAKDMGFESLDNLYAKLQSLGAEGQKLANTGLNIIGKKDEAGNRRWMADVTKFFDRLEKVPGKVNELSNALGKFGGAVPKALDPLLDSILGNTNLSADLRTQLEGMRKPSWQSAQELASTFGVNLGALGSGFNTSRLADRGFELKRALELFARFEGADQEAILRDMADEFSALAAESRKTGVALPRGIQDFIRRIDQMNLLLDENGERIDASVLTFADIEDEYQKQVVSLLEEIRDLLGGKGPAAGGGFEYSGVVRRPVFSEDPAFAMPSFAGGTHGRYMDFGAGTPVMLHGQERVMTSSERSGDTFVVNVSTHTPRDFENWLRSGGSRAVLRTLPDAVRKAALNR